MILQFHPGTPEEKVQAVRALCEAQGVRTRRSPDSASPIVAVVDKAPAALREQMEANPAIARVVAPQGSWRLADRAFRHTPQVVDIGGVRIGGGAVAIMAGPCSVDGHLEQAAEDVAASGGHILRGGAYKPRTSPYAFQGFGSEGLRRLKAAGDAVGLPVVSEIMDAAQLPAFVDLGIDCLQVGARNMQNFTLLKAIGACGIPVLLKRGLAATVSEWLMSAEYLLAGGNSQVILCERGIRTFESATRNTLDLTILPVLREWTHLPVVVDPAHAVGIARYIAPLARASLAAGADGLTVEMHPDPSVARSDADQALLPAELAAIIADARIMTAVSGKRLA